MDLGRANARERDQRLGVEELTAGQLRDQRGDAAGGQHIADVLRRPTAVAEDDGDERPEAGERSRQQKVDPVERALALARWRRLARRIGTGFGLEAEDVR